MRALNSLEHKLAMTGEPKSETEPLIYLQVELKHLIYPTVFRLPGIIKTI